MKFSSKARYGLRAIYELGKNYSNEPLSNSKLAQLTRVSEDYLEKILSTLKKNGIVLSKQGLNGGYVLSVEPQFLTIGKVLTALEGPLYASECVEKNCDNPSCPNKEIFSLIYKNINEMLNNLTLQDILNKQNPQNK